MKQRRYKGEQVRATLHTHEGGSESMDLAFQSSPKKADFKTTISASFYAKEDYYHASMRVHGVDKIDLGKWEKMEKHNSTEVRTIIITTDREYRPIEIKLFRDVEESE